MVRRRTRAAKTSSSSDGGGGPGVVVTVDLLPNGGVASAVPIGSALEDQYFASPKRKDCKIDCGESGEPVNNCDEDEKMCENVKLKGSSPGRSRGGISGRTIGVPLATRSQTRTIENYFKANTATKTSKLKAENVDQHYDENTYISIKCGSSISSSSRDTTDSSSQSPTELLNGDDPHSRSSLLHISAANSSDGAKTEFIFDLSEDTNDTDNTELSDECSAASGGSTNGPHISANFELHRSPMRDSHSSRSSTTDNIFLQEPVLTLNVDKSPNQASSIKINKSLEIEPIFSSPPAITAAVLNGRFNKIVSLNGSPSKRDSFGFETHPILINGNCYALSLDNDNSSCDSGVAFGTASVDTNSPNPAAAASRRRKPATPHRIVCPSPIKTAPRMVSPAGGAKGGLPLSPSGRKLASSKDVLSPRKSQRHLTSAGSKTRRRLNHSKEHQAPYQHQTTTTTTTMQNGCKQNGHIDAQAHIDDGNDDQECENHGDAAAVAVNFCQVPPLITSTKNTTAQQNSIINKSHKTTKTTSGKASAPVQQQHQQPKMKLHQAPQPLAATNGNRELTTFFPVRRSVRKTKTAVKEEMMRNLEQAILEERAEGLKVAHFEGKGRGIVADRRFERGEFVVEYVGDLISMTEAAEREKQYALDENAGCYMYYFKHKNQQYCIDATIDTGKLGRLVNHSRTGNLITKVVVVKQRPHLILIAKDDIEPGEELTYDYGDRSKESLLHHPWLAF